MSSQRLDSLIAQAELLSVEEQLKLAGYLVERARQTCATPAPHYRWRDVRGLARHPMLGQDAQDWVSRSRQEDTEGREKGWKHNQ